ncbi:MAG: putative ABC transporter permease [Anaerovoracaceae bacterium]
MYYNAGQWMLFFYIYCFLGWLWESTYVSVRRREWVNRGFMHGPFLPIYGSGAIVILFTTLAFRENLWMIYLLGMISATILEYFTGAAMEKLFHVRYWDYTGHRFNLKGRVCLSVSLGWGLFSVLLVKFIHPAVENLVIAVPPTIADIAALSLTAVTAADAAVSFNEAMDLKVMLTRLAESNDELRRLQKRIDFAAALAEDDIRRFREKQYEKKRKFKETVAENLQEARLRSFARLDEISARAEDYFANVEKNTEALKELKERIAAQRRKIDERSDREYTRLSRILHRNPGAVSKLHKEELDQLRKLLKK